MELGTQRTTAWRLCTLQWFLFLDLLVSAIVFHFSGWSRLFACRAGEIAELCKRGERPNDSLSHFRVCSGDLSDEATKLLGIESMRIFVSLEERCVRLL